MLGVWMGGWQKPAYKFFRPFLWTKFSIQIFLRLKFSIHHSNFKNKIQHTKNKIGKSQHTNILKPQNQLFFDKKDCAENKKNLRYFWIAPKLSSSTHLQIGVLILLHLIVFSLLILVKVIFYKKTQFNKIGPLWLSGKPARIEVGKEIQQGKWL